MNLNFGTDGVFEPRNYSERMLAKWAKAKAKFDRDKAKNPNVIPQPIEERVNPSRSATPSQAPVTSASAASDATFAAMLGMTSAQVASLANAKREMEQANAGRMDLFKSNMPRVSRLIEVVLPVLVSVYTVAHSNRIRGRVLVGLSRAISFSETSLLQSCLQVSF